MYVEVRRIKVSLKGGGEGERKSYFVATDAPMFYARISQSRQKKAHRKFHTGHDSLQEKRKKMRQAAAEKKKCTAHQTFLLSNLKIKVCNIIFSTTILSNYALILRVVAPPASFLPSCTPLDSLFHPKDPAALLVIAVKRLCQWFMKSAQLKCQGALPLHACKSVQPLGNKGAVGFRRLP